MASDKSTKAKVGTAVALIGGTVGTGIVVYALLGNQVDETRAAQEATVAATTDQNTDQVTNQANDQVTDQVNDQNTQTASIAATNDQTLETEPTEAPKDNTQTEVQSDTQDENSSDQTVDENTSTQSTDNAATLEPKVEGLAASGSETANDDEVADENADENPPADPIDPKPSTDDTTDLATLSTPKTDAPTEDEPTAQASLNPSTDGTSVGEDAVIDDPVATPQTDAPLTQDSIQSPSVTDTGEPSVTAFGSGPSVETNDPALPAADAVVLETSATPVNNAPQLDPNDPAVPKFDLVRVEADGSAVIAGRALPNSEVQILSNGVPIGSATASSRGEFVALIETELVTTAQALALIAAAPGGDEIRSQSNVIVLARTATEIDNLNEEISLAPAIVQATPDDVRVIQPVVGLADLDRVSLDTISYDQTGQVILAGRGRPGFTTRIYADDRSIIDSVISTSGTWSAMINDLDAGRYVIRVDELDLNGDVASRVESPFQRIYPTDEQLALLTDATSVIVQPGNNLWTIAEGRYGDGFRFTTIFEANLEQIRDPDLIFPGQVFELPEGQTDQ